MTYALRAAACALAIATTFTACDDDPVDVESDPVTYADVTRSYSAETLTTTSGGSSTDQLAAGTTLEITLHENGTTTGRLFVPDGAEGGGDLDADLAGTFAFDETLGEVTFDQVADTFVRDLVFTATRSDGVVQLEGERAFGSTTVRVVLR